MPKRLAAAVLIVTLPGCTTAWAFQGDFTDKMETLTGSTTHYADGGTLEIYGSRGTHCTGIFITRGVEGRGSLLCDDRRSGAFVVDMAKHNGTGKLGDRPFAFAVVSDKVKRKAPT